MTSTEAFLVGMSVGASAMWLYMFVAGLIRTRDEWMNAKGKR